MYAVHAPIELLDNWGVSFQISEHLWYIFGVLDGMEFNLFSPLFGQSPSQFNDCFYTRLTAASRETFPGSGVMLAPPSSPFRPGSRTYPEASNYIQFRSLFQSPIFSTLPPTSPDRSRE